MSCSPSLLLTIPPAFSKAGVKSENPAQCERHSYGSRFQGVDLQLSGHHTGAASLWAVNNVNMRQCMLSLSHSSQLLVKVTLENLLVCINFDTWAYPKGILLHEILAMTFKPIHLFVHSLILHHRK